MGAKATVDSRDVLKRMVRVLFATAAMLDYEATCHEESGDAKRRTYVAPLRAQVKASRDALASIQHLIEGGAS